MKWHHYSNTSYLYHIVSTKADEDISSKDGQIISRHGSDVVNPQYSARKKMGGVVEVRLNQCTCHMPYPMTFALIPFLHVKWEAFDVCWLNFYDICKTGTTTKAPNHAVQIRCMNLSECNSSFDAVSTPNQIENTYRKPIAHQPGHIVFHPLLNHTMKHALYVVVQIVINVYKLADVTCHLLPLII